MIPFHHELISILRVEQVSDEKVQALLTQASRKPTNSSPYSTLPDGKSLIKTLLQGIVLVFCPKPIVLYIREKEF